MDFYVIPPNNHLDIMHKGNRYFCLAQIYNTNEQYRNFFKQVKQQGGWITLDNGAGDHNLITSDILLQCVLDLMPNEVIPPDILYNSTQTINELNDFIDKMKSHNLLQKVEIFAVPQGNSIDEWLQCYDTMIDNKFVSTIGMSKLGIPHAFVGQAKNDQLIMESRHLCVDLLLLTNRINKPLHFLGSGNPNEFAKYIQLDNKLFRSTDSCNSIWSAMNNLEWNNNQFERIVTPHDYFDRIIQNDQLNIVYENINYLNKLLKK